MSQAILTTAIELAKALDRAADDILPKKLADIVKWHSRGATAAAFIPIPGADLVGGAVAIWGMYLRINKEIGVSIGNNIMKTIASGVSTNLLAYASALAVGSMLKFIPGIGTAGGTFIMAGTIYAVTIASGFVYLKVLTAIAKHDGTLAKIDASKLKTHLNNFISQNKGSIKDIIKEGRKDYSKNKDSMKVSEKEKREFEKSMKDFK